MYAELDALIAAGANITEIEKWLRGEYSPNLLATVVVWHRSSKLIAAHMENAQAEESKRRNKGK